MASQRLQTVQKFMDHFTSLDRTILASVLDESYAHEYRPSSVPLERNLDRDTLLGMVAGLKHIMQGNPMTIKEAIESESRNAVTIWATGKAAFHEELRDSSFSDYAGEYMFIFYLNDDGTKIIKTIEFVDNKAITEGLMPMVAKANEKLAVTA